MRILAIAILALFTLQSCNQGVNTKKDDSKQDETTQTDATQDVTETNIIENDVVENVAIEVNEKGSIKLTKDIFLEKVWDYESNSEAWVYKGDKPAIIDFYADWCRPCKIAGPILEELALKYANDIYVYKVDTETEQELASVFGITGIPAFLYIPLEGEPKMTSGIAQTDEETKAMFEDNIKNILLK